MYKRKLKKMVFCQHCGMHFFSHMPSARYCGGACRVAAYRRRQQLIEQADHVDVVELEDAYVAFTQADRFVI